MDRRKALKTSIMSVGTLAVTLSAATPSQPEGPFHPVNIDNDLRRIGRHSEFAEGLQLRVDGQISSSKNRSPVKGALVEIWQADAHGKYSHPGDPLPREPDRHFQFWGRATTDERGGYNFLTIKPGSYPADDSWTRPPHIHLRFSARGFQELTTQLYFSGEILNAHDRLLGQLSRRDQKKLILELRSGLDGLEHGVFNVELDPV